ncbi:MAG TPA: Lrp/AsnC family transcriptional regulator [Candidatus Binatia bacterium]|nr:Lrp/AsnC family transcriptional regulator [Candidatus Binatia bacterium]
MIDAVDREILSILQENARTSNVEVARRIGLAPSAVLERIRKLEKRGVIRGYEPRLNASALGSPLLAFIFVHADEKIGGLEIGRKIAKFPEVQEVHQVAGEDCYLVKVRIADTDALGRLLRDSFGALPAIRTTRTTIVLSSVKESAQMPLPPDGAAARASETRRPKRAAARSRRRAP